LEGANTCPAVRSIPLREKMAAVRPSLVKREDRVAGATCDAVGWFAGREVDTAIPLCAA